MHQLDLFGGEPAKPAQPKKKGYQLVKPAVLTVSETGPDAEPETPQFSAAVVTPEAVVEPPVQAAETPKAMVEPPVQAAETPKAMVEPPVQAAETPKATVEPPVQAAETPKAVVEPPVQATETPKIEVELPVQATVTLKNEEPALENADGKVETGKKSRTRIPLDIGRLNPSSSKINVPEDEILFSKQYYPIGEVAVMFNVNISLIRFWEKEFDILQPRKNGKGDRLFRPEDIKNLKMIFFLLKEKKYTIEGAKTFLKQGKKATQGFEAVETLKNIKSMLIVLKSSL